MTTRKEKIISKALEILKSNPNGVRYSDLIKRIHNEFPDFPQGTIHGNIWNLETRVPNDVYKPARGIFRHISFREEEIVKEEEKPSLKIEKINE